ncbi:hypothetical protein [Dermatobacter hominis]|uniref:hypothetical protein n=1 Tax=Dermatobacter hominis TaxID=2884263 RepID=UPI001D12D6AA|nr:hypothetical protein [Dermatobacter hominis]UDY35859.1 hypothetical protein LH044_21390 [Dermatobacter hominis]
MRKLLVAAAVVTAGLVAGACAPPPDPGPGTTTTTEPGGLPAVPRLAAAPIGAESFAAIVEVRGFGAARLYASTDTWHRELDPTDLGDLTAMYTAARQVDQAGRLIRSAGVSFDDHWLEMCDTVAAVSCTEIPDTDMFGRATFSPDGTMVFGVRQPLDGPPTLRIFDATTFETIVEVTRNQIDAGIMPGAWRADSGAIALVLDQELYTLDAEPGAEPQLVTGTDISTWPIVRQAGFVVGWTAEGRIVSGWGESDWSTWPPTGSTVVLETVDPDGTDRRELGPLGTTGYGTMAPNGAVVWPAASGVTGIYGPGSVPHAHFDADGAPPQALSLPWNESGPDGLMAAQVNVLGFVPRAAVGAP